MTLQQQISNMWRHNYANIAGYGCQAENLVIHITAVSEMTVMLHWNRRWNAFSDDKALRLKQSGAWCVTQSVGVTIRLYSTLTSDVTAVKHICALGGFEKTRDWATMVSQQPFKLTFFFIYLFLNETACYVESRPIRVRETLLKRLVY